VNTATFANYNLRNLETREDTATGHTGGTAMLFAGDERVARVELNPRDGSVALQFKGPVQEYVFLRHIAGLPTDAFDAPFADRRTAAALFVLELCDRQHELRWLRKRCQTSTVYRIDGDPVDEWRSIKVRFCDEVAKRLRKAARGRLECIANEALVAA
jgi:hypothetical protein